MISFITIFETLILPEHLTGLSAYLTHFLLLILISMHLFLHKLSKMSLLLFWFFFPEVYFNPKSSEYLKSENVLLLIHRWQLGLGIEFLRFSLLFLKFCDCYSMIFGFSCCEEAHDQPTSYSLWITLCFQDVIIICEVWTSHPPVYFSVVANGGWCLVIEDVGVLCSMSHSQFSRVFSLGNLFSTLFVFHPLCSTDFTLSF